MNKKQSQAGSSHLILIIVLVVVVLGALGYIYWTNYTKSKTTTTPTVSNSSIPSKTSTISMTTADDEKYFAITEWGIKGVYDGKYNLSYEVINNENNSTSIGLTTSDSPSECQGRTLNVIRRYSKDDTITFSGHIALETPISPVQAYKDWSRSRITKAGDYYYVLDQGVTDDCPGIIGEESVESVVMADIKDFFISLQTN